VMGRAVVGWVGLSREGGGMDGEGEKGRLV
jgi:hypothetical protein